MIMEERRRYPRLTAQFPVRYSLVPSSVSAPVPQYRWIGTANNISTGGINISLHFRSRFTRRKLIQGKIQFNMEFVLPGTGDVIRALGILVWVSSAPPWWRFFNPPFRVGVQFTHINKADRDKIMGYVIKRTIESQVLKNNVS